MIKQVGKVCECSVCFKKSSHVTRDMIKYQTKINNINSVSGGRLEFQLLLLDLFCLFFKVYLKIPNTHYGLKRTVCLKTGY